MCIFSRICVFVFLGVAFLFVSGPVDVHAQVPHLGDITFLEVIGSTNKRSTIRASDGHVYEIRYTKPLNVADFYIHGLKGEVPSREVAAELYNAAIVLNLPPFHGPGRAIYLEGEVRSAYHERLDTEIVLAATDIVAAATIVLATGGAGVLVYTLDIVKDTGLEIVDYKAKKRVLYKAMLIALGFAANAKHYEAMVNDHWLFVDKQNETSYDKIKSVWSARLKVSFYQSKTYEMMAEEILDAGSPLEHIIGWIPLPSFPFLSASQFLKSRVLEQKEINYLNTLTETTEAEITNAVTPFVNALFSKAAIAKTIATLEQGGFYNRQPPVVQELIEESWLTFGGDYRLIDMTNKFSDPNGDPLTYRIKEISNKDVVDVQWTSIRPFGESASRLMLELTPKNLGEAWVTIEATDPKGLSGEQSFKVVVAPANAPPQLSRPLPPQTLTPGSSSEALDLTTYFYDLDSERIAAYMSSSNNTSVATVQPPTGSVITISARGLGETTVTVAATDSDGASTTADIAVRVEASVNTDFPDLSVQSISASAASVAPGGRFRLDTVIQNQGNAASQRTTLRFYRSSDPDISPDDTPLHAQTVHGINVGRQITPWKRFTAPDVPGVYYYGVCVDRSGDERVIDNNCSEAIKITVLQPTLPDLIVESISVSKSTLAPGERFTLSATVRNIGTARSQFGVLHYYDKLGKVDKRNIRRLFPNQTSDMSIQLEAPEEPGVYYYDASISKVRDEVNTDNNDSNRVAITVGAPAAVNQAPIASVTIPTRKLTVGGSSIVIDVSGNFRDPDNNRLDYWARSDNVRVAEARASGSQVTLIPRGVGVTTVTVTASDGVLTAVQRFSVSVTAAPVANRPPVNVRRIPDQTLVANGAVVRLNLLNYFWDADGDTLKYIITSDNTNVAFLQIVGTHMSIQPLGIIGRANVRVTASDGNLTAIQDFTVLVQRTQPVNRPPAAIGTITPQTLTVGTAGRGNISEYFRDPDGNTLTYTARSDNTNVVRASMSRADLTLTPVRAGSTTVTVTASDGSSTATQRFTVQVQSQQRTQPVNQPPAAIGTISPQTFTVNGTSWRVNIANYFRDADGDSLTYTAWSDNTNIATVRRSGAEVTITPQGVGSTTIHVTASDGSLEATQSISVTVTSAERVEDPTSFDLAIQSVTPSKRTLDPGESFTLSVTIRNNGPGASGSVHLSYYHSSVQGRAPTDPPQLEGTQWLNAIASGDSITEVFRLNAPSTPKTYYYGALLSPNADDTNLFNNIAPEVGVTVRPPPNVVAPEVDVPVQPPQQVQNQAPTVGGAIPAQTLTVGAAAGILLSGYFRDPDGDSLTYTARSDDTNVVTTQISGDALTITPVRAGSATITVTVNDGSLTATHRFTVTVQSATFRVGDAIIVQNSKGGGLNGLIVRNGAGTGFTHTISVFNGATGTITDGPQRATGYTWWKVQWDHSDQVFCDVNPCVGWVFELFQGTRVIAKNSAPLVEIKSSPDLVIQSVRVSDDTLMPNESFKFYATIRNQGAGEASRTTLRYYRSSDATISTTDTRVDTDSVTSLDPNESDEEWDSLRAPHEPGIYYYGVCVDSVTDESNTNNNCSRGIRITVAASSPDLVTESVRVSDDTVEVGDRFTLYATVRNQGNGDARSTTLRYYRSSDSSISERDTEEDTDSVRSLDADETSEERVTITAPNQSGTYYYGVCVDDVRDESNTNNNCSRGVRVSVADAIIVRPRGLSRGDSIVVQNSKGGGLNGLIVRSGAGTGFKHIISVFNGATGTITDGPESANGYTWWKVRWDRSDQVFCDVNPCVGWVFEFFRGTRVIAEDDALAAPALHVVIPTETVLLSNYPNPFNPETWIPYQLSGSADVSVSIYSVNGHLVRRLELGHQLAGVYQRRSRAAYWDGRNEFGERVASGLYFYTLTAGDFTATRKMLIRK